MVISSCPDVVGLYSLLQDAPGHLNHVKTGILWHVGDPLEAESFT